MSIEALGRVFDVCTGIVPIDLAAGANTGHRVHLKNYDGVAIVLFFNNGIAAEPVVATVQEHNAASAGTSQSLAVIDHYYVKSEAALDGDETWSAVTQSASATITNADWDDALEGLVVAEVQAASLSDGFEWISVNIADTGAGGAHVGAALYIPYDLKVQRAPENLAQPNA